MRMSGYKLLTALQTVDVLVDAAYIKTQEVRCECGGCACCPIQLVLRGTPSTALPGKRRRASCLAAPRLSAHALLLRM